MGNFFTKNLQTIDGTNCQKMTCQIFPKMSRKFFMNFFMLTEGYFRSPFSHLPVAFAQTLIVSSPIFSANLEPFRVSLRGLEALKLSFSALGNTVKSWVRVNYCAYGHASACF